MNRRRRNDRDVSGVLVLDKPPGITSHDLVVRVRRAFGTSRVGHAGTLDPLASGVMVLLLGTATRASEYLQEDDKEYRLTLLLGRETDTQDVTGAPTGGGDTSRVTREALAEALASFTGTFRQVPPVFSAVKVGGQPLHRLARRGKDPAPAPPREVTVRSLALGSWEPPRAVLTVACSKGTYMRTLCHDIGRRLGVGGCLEALVRTRSGRFSLADALAPEAILAAPDPDSLLRDTPSALPFPLVEAAQVDLAGILAGRAVPWPAEAGDPPAGGMAAVARGKELLAVAEVRREPGGGAVLAPRKVFPPPPPPSSVSPGNPFAKPGDKC